MSWVAGVGLAIDAGLKGHDQIVKNQQQYLSNCQQTQGYGLTYEEGQRLWREHKEDGKAKSVLDNHWNYSPAECWNAFANGYDDAKNADGVSGRGPRRKL